MDFTRFRLIAGIISTIISLSIVHQCAGQQNTIFNQSPFQRRQHTPQLRQQLQQVQQRQVFPNTLPVLSPPISPISSISPIAPLNTLTPISPIAPQQGIFRGYNQINAQNYVPITAYQNELNYDGSFSYGYASADGTTAQAQGYVKNLGYGEAVEAQVVQGSYSYTSPEGTPITVNYIADENGFRAEGNHLPQQPFQNFLNPNVNPYQTGLRQLPTQSTLLPGQQLSPLQLQQQQQQRGFQQQNTGQYQPGGQANNFQLPQQFGFGGGGGGGGGVGGYNAQTGFSGGGQQLGIGSFAFGTNFNPQQQQQQQQPFNQQNFTQQQQNQQQNLQQQQAAAAQQQQLQQNNQLQQQQQQQQQQQRNLQNQQQQQQQQQLATQELRGRPDQFVGPYGYNPYQRFKKSVKQ